MCFAAGWPDGKDNTFDAESSQDIDSGRLTSGAADEEESVAPEQRHLSVAEANENSSQPLYEDTGVLSNDSAEEAAAEESVEETEEDDDSGDDEG